MHARPHNARLFYTAIGAITVAAVALNFLGFNAMKALVWSGIVQGFSVPPLLFMMMLMTNDKVLMGDRRNTRITNIFGWATTGITGLATIGLVASWFL